MARSRTSLHLRVKHGNPPFRPWRSIVRTHKPNMCSRKQAIGLAKSGPHSTCERAIELNANFALGHFYLGIGLSLDGRHEEALKAIETGLRLSPRDPRASTWLANKARALSHLRRYEEASETALAARRVQPHAYGSLVLVASYAQLGRNEEARNALAEIRTLPGGSADTTRWYLHRYSDPVAREHMTEGLRKAGVLE